jgi:hypothetical protein
MEPPRSTRAIFAADVAGETGTDGLRRPAEQ